MTKQAYLKKLSKMTDEELFGHIVTRAMPDDPRRPGYRYSSQLATMELQKRLHGSGHGRDAEVSVDDELESAYEAARRAYEELTGADYEQRNQGTRRRPPRPVYTYSSSSGSSPPPSSDMFTQWLTATTTPADGDSSDES